MPPETDEISPRKKILRLLLQQKDEQLQGLREEREIEQRQRLEAQQLKERQVRPFRSCPYPPHFTHLTSQVPGV